MNQPRMICPVCAQTTTITDVRAGRFRVGCPRCDAPLILTVLIEPEVVVSTEVEPKGDVAAKSAPALTATSGRVQRDGGAGWLGRYRLRGGWDAIRAGVGLRGSWLGVGPLVGVVMVRDRWATDAPFLARWTSEALAATQLRHPNLLSPFALEVAGDRVFAVGALDDSTPLSDLSRKGTPFDRSARVAAILQAARGLRRAHEQGVFHRDLSPAAIRVDAEGQVTVTGVGVGVGLVPTATETAPATSISLAESPVTSPSIIPDTQNDILGLGEVLSNLVAGASGDRAVPPGLAGMIRRMGVRAESSSGANAEQFRDMGAVIRALEVELGVVGPWTPPEPDREAFDLAILDYGAAPLAPIRRWVGPGALTLWGLIVLAQVVSGRVGSALGWLVFGGLVAIALAGFRGFAARDQHQARIAAVLSVLSRLDLFALGLGGFLTVLVLVVLHGFALWIFAVAAAIGLAASEFFGLDRPLEQSRAEARARLKALIRGWRHSGVDESAIRRFVAGAGGKGWEEVFSALFGPDSVPPARAIWGLDLAGHPRPRFAVVRSWLMARVDAVILGRTFDRTRALLEPIFERDLEARGMQILTARRKAKRAAEAVVAVASQYRRSPDESVGLPLVEAFRQAVDHPEKFLLSPEIAETDGFAGGWSRAQVYFETLFGRRVRFLIGVAALVGGLIWMEANSLVSFAQLERLLQNVALEWDWPRASFQAREIGQRFVDQLIPFLDLGRQPDPMHVRFLPDGLTERLSGFALAASGLILLVSSMLGGVRIIPFALAGAMVPLIPHLVLATTNPLGPLSLAAMALGAAVLGVGVWVAQGRSD